MKRSIIIPSLTILTLSLFVLSCNITDNQVDTSDTKVTPRGTHKCKWDLPDIGALDCPGGGCYLEWPQGTNQVCIVCPSTQERSCIVPPNPAQPPSWTEWYE